MAPPPESAPRPSSAAPSDDPGEEVSITNEFTSVRVRKVWTRNGERLRIHSAKLGFTVDLDPLELESLTWQTPEKFSELLHSPYGPDDPQARPLLATRDDLPED